MGRRISAYLLYGFSLNGFDVSGAELEVYSFTEDHPGVGYLRANGTSDEELFLTANVKRADLGEPTLVYIHRSPEMYESWKRRLARAAADLGVTDYPDPCWLLVADVF